MNGKRLVNDWMIDRREALKLFGAGLAVTAGAPAVAVAAAPKLPDRILFGVAYYDEYIPADRLHEDVRMMRAAGINVVRIAESTWGTLEPQPGVFDFRHVDRVLDAMHGAEIRIIVGTPTYALPTWLARQHPGVLVETAQARAPYGPRQNMDITDPDFRVAARRVIVALVDHVRNHPAVIGYQVDNETKAYRNSGPRVQAAFIQAMRRKFSHLNALNEAWGLDYWSNRINRWEDFPPVDGAINASLSNAFAEFQRGLVTEYLAWQAGLVRAHARPDQFITHNFDLDWRGYSYGIQPEVNHWEAAKALDVAGVDIYHPTQDSLTGAEIAFGGDLARSMRNGQNYLVIETEAQGFPQWTPYPGQLRLQAYSHLASGANMVEYWHWSTTHNGAETYWRGLLSQDYAPNPTYEEAKLVGAELQRLGGRLANLRKRNNVAIYVSNRALSAWDAFKLQGPDYNTVVRSFYDALYRMNVEVDIIAPDSQVRLEDYQLIVVPALYAASDAEINRLNAFAQKGGHLVYTFRSGFADENNKVRHTAQPGGISAAAGVRYSQFTVPENVTLEDDPFGVGEAANKAENWIEFLTPTTATVLARYKHAEWPGYAAVTRNTHGRGKVTYVGFMPTAPLTEKILQGAVEVAGVAPTIKAQFPLIVRGGHTNGRRVRYVLNYSSSPQRFACDTGSSVDLLSERRLAQGEEIELRPWGVAIIEDALDS